MSIKKGEGYMNHQVYSLDEIHAMVTPILRRYNAVIYDKLSTLEEMKYHSADVYPNESTFFAVTL